MSGIEPQPKPGLSRAATRKRKRLYIVLAGMTMLGIAVALVLTAFQDNGAVQRHAIAFDDCRVKRIEEGGEDNH